MRSLIWKKIGIIIFFIFIILQFFQPSLPEVKSENPNDLILNNPDIDGKIVEILRISCYDCHSNETYYPWYSSISPISILVARDTKVGRSELNFSDWEKYSKIKKAGFLDNISSVIAEKEMPMNIYTIIHSNAKLSNEERVILIKWTEDFAEKLFE